MQRLLLLYPKFTRSHLLNYKFMAPFFPGKVGVMPPTGLLVIGAAFCDDGWEVRLVDENVRPIATEEIEWADVVGLSGMHQQRARMTELVEECNRLGKITVVGGSSANICPEYYPMADVLHVGEMGDATTELLAFLRTNTSKPPRQVVFTTREKASLDEQPMPALQLIDVNAYLLQPLQFSVGCPFTCEFCDIPIIYGRVARLKSAARVKQELDALYSHGFIGSVMFVDDNLIANRKALRALLPELIEWQKAHDYPFPLTSEASVNLARDEEILNLLRDARFTHMFIGVESPDPDTLVQISKKQNVMDPMLESLRIIESHGIEVIIGMIFGFDTDTLATGDAITAFIGEVNAPIIHFNMLAALPKTPLWDRMEQEGRLLADDDDLKLENLLGCFNSNVRMKLPNASVKQMLIDTMRAVYTPEKIYERFTWNLRNVYGKQRFGRPPSRTWSHAKFMFPFALRALRNVFRVGFTAPYRRLFWRFLREAVGLRLRGRIPSILDVLFKVTPTAYHLIEWNKTYLADAALPDTSVPERPALPAAGNPLAAAPPAQGQLVKLKSRQHSSRPN